MAAAGHEDRDPAGADWTVSARAAVAPGASGAGPGDVENWLRAGTVDPGDRLRPVADSDEPAPDFAAITEAWPSAGDPHHIVLTAADGAGCPTDLARLADIEPIYLNAMPTAGSIAEALRVGAADNRMRDH